MDENYITLETNIDSKLEHALNVMLDNLGIDADDAVSLLFHKIVGEKQIPDSLSIAIPIDVSVSI